MQMTLDQFTSRFPDRRQPVPAEFGGQWVAWNEDRTEILAHGANMSEVREEAVSRGYARPVLQKIPHGPFVGGA